MAVGPAEAQRLKIARERLPLCLSILTAAQSAHGRKALHPKVWLENIYSECMEALRRAPDEWKRSPPALPTDELPWVLPRQQQLLSVKNFYTLREALQQN